MFYTLILAVSPKKNLKVSRFFIDKTARAV